MLEQAAHHLDVYPSDTQDDLEDDDEIHFIEESDADPIALAANPWKILVADDDTTVHETTMLALKDVRIHGRPLEFTHAYSAKEALGILTNDSDINLLLLDVVMETSDAGLKLVNAIRNGLKREKLRIILRTGQPGNAGPIEVSPTLAINGYTTKSQLTRSLLVSILSEALPEE